MSDESSELDPVVAKFEERILAVSTDPEEEPNIKYDIEKSDTVRTTSKRLPKKAKLIDSIEKFRGYLPELIPTNNRLKKTRIADLEKLLARCIATSAGLQMKPEHQTEETDNRGPEVVETEVVETEVGGGGGGGININSAHTGAKTLYMANLGLVSVLEQVSRQTAEYTGVVVEGWSDDIKNDREQLMQILEGVYAENAQVVQAYMSPTSVWALYMLSSGAGHLKGAQPLPSSPE